MANETQCHYSPLFVAFDPTKTENDASIIQIDGRVSLSPAPIFSIMRTPVSRQ